jgi:hypothetical protein
MDQSTFESVPGGPALPTNLQKPVEEWFADIIDHGDRLVSRSVGGQYVYPSRQRAAYRKALDWPQVRFILYVDLLKRYRLQYTINGVPCNTTQFAPAPSTGGQIEAGPLSGVLPSNYGTLDYTIDLNQWDELILSDELFVDWYLMDGDGNFVQRTSSGAIVSASGTYTLTLANLQPNATPFNITVAIAPAPSVNSVHNTQILIDQRGFRGLGGLLLPYLVGSANSIGVFSTDINQVRLVVGVGADIYGANSVTAQFGVANISLSGMDWVLIGTENTDYLGAIAINVS